MLALLHRVFGYEQDPEAEPIAGAKQAARNDQRVVGAREGEENAHRDRQEREGDP